MFFSPITSTSFLGVSSFGVISWNSSADTCSVSIWRVVKSIYVLRKRPASILFSPISAKNSMADLYPRFFIILISSASSISILRFFARLDRASLPMSARRCFSSLRLCFILLRAFDDVTMFSHSWRGVWLADVRISTVSPFCTL